MVSCRAERAGPSFQMEDAALYPQNAIRWREMSESATAYHLGRLIDGFLRGTDDPVFVVSSLELERGSSGRAMAAPGFTPELRP